MLLVLKQRFENHTKSGVDVGIEIDRAEDH